jgi:diguanylate cyclase (GGDEF)-like protein
MAGASAEKWSHMSTLTPTQASHRVIVLATASLGVAAAAIAIAPLLVAHVALVAAASAGATLLLATAAVVWYAGGKLTGVLRTAEDAAAGSRSELQVTLDNMSQGLVLCDHSARVVAVNNRFVQLFGLDPWRVRPGMAVADLIRLQAEAGDMPKEQAEMLIHERHTRQPGASGRLEMAFRQGVFQVAYQPRPEGGWCCTFEDVTAQKEAQARLAFLAQHDALTSLPNRALLRERIDAAIAAGAAFAVMLIDLDHFKLANDTFGHGVGDALLCAVAERLHREVSETDTVARLGGDEFAVLMSAPCAREDAERQAARLVRALVEPFHLEGHCVHIGASVGITLANRADLGLVEGIDMLLHQADVALYRVKEDGRSAYRLYDPSMERSPVLDCAVA